MSATVNPSSTTTNVAATGQQLPPTAQAAHPPALATSSDGYAYSDTTLRKLIGAIGTSPFFKPLKDPMQAAITAPLPAQVRAQDPAFFNWPKAAEGQFYLAQTGHVMNMPFYVRNAKATMLSFVADTAKLDAQLKKHGLEAIPLRDYDRYAEFGFPSSAQLRGMASATQLNSDASSRVSPGELDTSAMIFIATNDFVETPAGRIRPSYVGVWVKPNAEGCYLQGDKCNKPGLFFMQYYVDTPDAKAAGEETWGLTKKLGQPRNSVVGARKEFSYEDNGTRQRVYDLVWNQSAPQRLPSTHISKDDVPASARAGVLADDPPELVGITVNEHQHDTPGQTFNVVKWGAESMEIDVFQPDRGDSAKLNGAAPFIAPFVNLDAKPLFWSHFDGNRVVYHTGKKPRG